MNKRQIAGWISPHGAFFPLEHGLQFHADWASHHVMDINTEAPHTKVTRTDSGMGRMKKMWDAGWIKKTSHDIYTGTQHDDTVGTIKAHMREHAPDQRRFCLITPYHQIPHGGTTNEHRTEHTLDEMIDTPKSTGVGWLAPSGKFFPLEPMQLHAEWAQKHGNDINRETSHLDIHKVSGMWDRLDHMYNAGWVRKQGHGRYVGPARDETLDMIRSHIREHAPHTKAFGMYGPDGGRLSIHSVNESVDFLITNRLSGKPIQEAIRSARKSIRKGVRAWISPEGTIHPLATFGSLGPGYHPEWVTSNLDKIHKKHIAYSGGMFNKIIDRQETMRKMILGGWIKKDAPNKYQTSQQHVKLAAEHFLSHHPNRYANATIIAHHHGGNQTRYTVSREGELRRA